MSKRAGQVVVEYFILFMIVALVTLVAVTGPSFGGKIKTALEGLVGSAAAKMAVENDQSSGEGPGLPPEPDPCREPNPPSECFP